MNQFNRRSVLRGIGALGVSGALTSTGIAGASRQVSTEDGVITIEAESAEDQADFPPLAVGTDSNASSGEYVYVPDGNDSMDGVPADGRATYEFTLDQMGEYYLEGRVRADGSGSDSAYVSLDGDDFVPWYFDLSEHNAWQWDYLLSSDTLTLSEGTHTLTIAYREDLAELDQFRVTESDDGGSATLAPGESDTVQTISSGALGSNRRPNTFGLYDSSVDQTFVSYMGASSDPYVQSYDHETGSWSDPKRAVDASVGLDLHNYPMMIQSDDGKIQLFYTEHNEMMYQATASEPSTIDAAWAESAITEGAYSTYPFPVKASNGDIFVFYRETTQNDPDSGRETDYRPLQYVRSTDNGQTWSHNSSLTGSGPAIGHTRDDNLNEIYLGQVRREPQARNRPDRFHLVWTLAGGGPQGHEHDRYHEHVYHAYFVPSELRFYAMDGTDLGHRIGEADSENHCKVYDTGEPTNPETADDPFDVGYRQVVHYTDAGDPVVVFEHVSMGLVSARWTGRQWTTNGTDLPDGGIGDLERVGPRAFRFYATDSGVDDVLQVFESTDGGRSWEQADTINYPTGLHYTHNVLQNAEPSARIMSLEADGGNVYVSGYGTAVAQLRPSTFDATVGERITFDVEDTTGEDRWIESLQWDFGDGTTATGWWNDHSYDEPGVYTALLTATDNTGRSTTRDTVITVESLSEPLARIRPSTTEAEAGERVTFDVEDTTGEDRWIESLQWDFGDGTTATGQWTEHTYDEPGSYTVSLTATDNTGRATTDEVTLSIA